MFENKKFIYNFPPYRNVPSDDIGMFEQLHYMKHEAKEAIEAAEIDKDDYAAVVETLDTIHAAETALRSMPPEMVEKAYHHVIEKNDRRNYYIVSEKHE